MNKKILITGINGFIGSNCKEFYEANGFEVYGIDINGTPIKNIIIGDVNIKNIKVFNQEFDTIIHLAGTGTVSMAQNNSEREKEKSVGSCKEILEYINKYNSKACLIFSSSAAVYGNSFKEHISEHDKTNPISVYGQHKLEAEKLCKEYAEKYNLNIKIARIFSVYGNGLKKQLLWDFSSRLNKAQDEILCFGNGNEKRDFIHITDLINLFELIRKEPFGFDIYNCASGVETTVKEIISHIISFNKKNINLQFDNLKREGNPEILIANIEKVKKIGFVPKKTLEEGIKDYVKWFNSIK